MSTPKPEKTPSAISPAGQAVLEELETLSGGLLVRTSPAAQRALPKLRAWIHDVERRLERQEVMR